jgi:hypothetical protein
MNNKHGCCADKACNSSTCMELPTGKTCGDCRSLSRCAAFVGRKGTETSCDWFPRHFIEKAAPGVKGTAFSDFIRNGTDERKAEVYGKVMDKVDAQQQAVIAGVREGGNG